MSFARDVSSIWSAVAASPPAGALTADHRVCAAVSGAAAAAAGAAAMTKTSCTRQRAVRYSSSEEEGVPLALNLQAVPPLKKAALPKEPSWLARVR